MLLLRARLRDMLALTALVATTAALIAPVHGARLVVAGIFSAASSVKANSSAAWNGDGWEAFPRRPFFSSRPIFNCIAQVSGEVYVGGSFQVNDEQMNIARWDAATDAWTWVGPANASGIGGAGVKAIVEYQGDLVIGGAIDHRRNVRGIARWNATLSAWLPVGNQLASGHIVRCMTVYNGMLIAGGDFYGIGLPANTIAFWDGVQWTSPGTGLNSPTYSLTVFQGDLIAGGYFDRAGDVAAEHIARWNGTAWSALGSNLDIGWIYALATYHGELVAGGDTNGCIAKWDGTAWVSLGAGLSSGPYASTVNALTVNGEDLIAGGTFESSGAIELNNIGRWNGASWSPLLSGIDGFVAGALALHYDSSLE